MSKKKGKTSTGARPEWAGEAAGAHPAKADRRLLEAVALGPDAVEAAIAAGAGAEAASAKGRYGWTPFLQAVSKRCMRSVELLMPLSDAGALDDMSRSALFLAMLDSFAKTPEEIEKKDKEAAEILKIIAPFCDGLIQNDMGVSPLMMAAGGGLVRCMEILLPISDLEAKNYRGATAVVSAAAFNMVECLGLLLANGAKNEAEKDGRDALMAAAANGSTDAVRALLAHGWGMEGSGVAKRNDRGHDALDLAMGLGSQECAVQIASQLMPIWAKRPDGKTRAQKALLKSMSRDSSEDMAREMLKWADVNARVDGESALDAAAKMGLGAKIIELLLSAGADANARNPEGKTALTLAAEKGHWLAEAGSKKAKLWLESVEALALASSQESVEDAKKAANAHRRGGWESFDHAMSQELARHEAMALSQEIAGGNASGGAKTGVADGHKTGRPSRRAPRAL